MSKCAPPSTDTLVATKKALCGNKMFLPSNNTNQNKAHLPCVHGATTTEKHIKRNERKRRCMFASSFPSLSLSIFPPFTAHFVHHPPNYAIFVYDQPSPMLLLWVTHGEKGPQCRHACPSRCESVLGPGFHPGKILIQFQEHNTTKNDRQG